MALEVAETQTRLRRDLAERARVQRTLENSEAYSRSQQHWPWSSSKDTEGGGSCLSTGNLSVCSIVASQVCGRLRRRDSQEIARHFRQHLWNACGAICPRDSGDRAAGRRLAYLYQAYRSSCARAKGVAYGVCGISFGITERKRSDQALRAPEALSGDFRASEDSIFVT
jgi:hypothetical protein